MKYTLDKIVKELCEGDYSSIYISYNDHKVNYETVEEYFDRHPETFPFVNGESGQQLACNTNTLWTVKVYPDNPRTSYVMNAATYEELHNYLENMVDENERL